MYAPLVLLLLLMTPRIRLPFYESLSGTSRVAFYKSNHAGDREIVTARNHALKKKPA